MADFIPTPGVKASEELIFYAEALRLEKLSLERRIDSFSGFSDPLLALMQRQLPLTENLLQRMFRVNTEEPFHWLSYGAISHLHEILDPKPKIYPHTLYKNLGKLGKDRESIEAATHAQEVLFSYTKDILRRNPPPLHTEIGARVLILSRAWEDDLSTLPDFVFENRNDPLLEDEIRRRLRVLEGLRRRISEASQRYAVENLEWFEKLDLRLRYLLDSTKSALGKLKVETSPEAVEVLRETTTPLQTGLGKILNALKISRGDIVIDKGEAFAAKHGDQLMRSFSSQLRPAASLFIGFIIAGHFALQDLSHGENPGVTVLRFGADVFQNFSQSKTLQLASLGLSLL